MFLREIDNKQTWQSFVEAHAPRSGAFLQCWRSEVARPTGRLQSFGRGGRRSPARLNDFSRSGGEVRRLGAYENNKLVAVAMVSVVRLPLWLSYALIERGPLVRKAVDLGAVVEAIGKEVDTTFVRFEPATPLLFKEGQGVVIKKTIHVSPEETLILDLSHSEDELLSAMHPKTRYNIRLSRKKGVVVRELRRDERELAWKLFEETAKRDQFRLHNPARYEAWLETFPGARLVGAFYDGELLAVNLMVDAFGTRTYLHGASSSRRRDVMAPYALHWHEIMGAKKEGLVAYDFWGISESNPAWKGITRFKLGFGGERVRYSGTFDFVLDRKRYGVYQTLRKIRRSANRS